MRLYELSPDGRPVIYHVDEENGVVVATSPYTPHKSLVEPNSLLASLISTAIECERVVIPPIVKGIAKLHPSDEFDLDYGRELSYRRMIRNEKRIDRRLIEEIYKVVRRSYYDIHDLLIRARIRCNNTERNVAYKLSERDGDNRYE